MVDKTKEEALEERRSTILARMDELEREGGDTLRLEEELWDVVDMLSELYGV